MIYKKGNTYIVERNKHNNITPSSLTIVTILFITNTCYFVRWNFDKGSDCLKIIAFFDKNYSLIEDITIHVPDMLSLIKRK
jgi:hypothetical protein